MYDNRIRVVAWMSSNEDYHEAPSNRRRYVAQLEAVHTKSLQGVALFQKHLFNYLAYRPVFDTFVEESKPGTVIVQNTERINYPK